MKKIKSEYRTCVICGERKNINLFSEESNKCIECLEYALEIVSVKCYCCHSEFGIEIEKDSEVPKYKFCPSCISKTYPISSPEIRLNVREILLEKENTSECFTWKRGEPTWHYINHVMMKQ